MFHACWNRLEVGVPGLALCLQAELLEKDMRAEKHVMSETSEQLRVHEAADPSKCWTFRA